MELFRKLEVILDHLEKRYPEGNHPFQIITRLCEETGELASEVNHFEGSGIKNEKHGTPDKEKMAKEVQDVIRCALQIARYYKIEPELNASIDASLKKAQG